MENIVGKLQRHYVGEGVWRTVQADKTGDYGNLHYNIYEEDTDYKLIFVDSQNNILETTQSMKFICTAGVCEITYMLLPVTDTDTIYNMTITPNYNNETGIITVTWADPDGFSATVYTYVTKETLTSSLVICNVTTTAAAGTHTCNISGLTGTFLLKVSSSRSPTEYHLTEFFHVAPRMIGSLLSKGDSAFLSFGIIITIVAAGLLFSPVAALIMTVLGLIVIFFLGMMSAITFPVIVIVGIITIIISIKVKT